MKLRHTVLALASPLLSVAIAAISFAQTKEALKIGVPTALSGSFAEIGGEVRKAITFAIDEANAKGGVDGRKVEASFLDTEGKADAARRQAEKLALGGYKILTGTLLTGESVAIGNILERQDAIFIPSISSGDAVTGDGCKPRMFRTTVPDYAYSAVVRPWLQTRKETKWAIAALDVIYGRNSADSFRTAARALQKEVVSESFAPVGTTDFAPYIQKIKDSGAEALYITIFGREAVNFIVQAKQFGLLEKIFVAGPVAFFSDNQLAAMGQLANGINGFTNYSSTVDSPANKKFVRDWVAKFPGTLPSNYEGSAYIGMQVIYQAVEKAKSVTPAEIARVMPGMTFETLLGARTMRPQDNQLTGPILVGHVGAIEGKLRALVTGSIPADVVMPNPNPACKL